MAKKKNNSVNVSVSYPSNKKNITKSITILKLCETSFKWDLAGCFFYSFRDGIRMMTGGQEFGNSVYDFHGLYLL